jgi:hypothetical protein
MMLTKRQFEVMLDKYEESIEEYIMLSKDAGFKFMEELIAEIEDEEGLEWGDAYDTFNDMVFEVMTRRARQAKGN